MSDDILSQLLGDIDDKSEPNTTKEEDSLILDDQGKTAEFKGGPLYQEPLYIIEEPQVDYLKLKDILQAYDDNVQDGVWPNVLPYTQWHDGFWAYYYDWMTSWFPSIRRAAQYLNVSHPQLTRYKDQKTQPSAQVYCNVTKELFQYAMQEYFPDELEDNQELHQQTPLYPPYLLGWFIKIIARERFCALPDALRKTDFTRQSLTRLALKPNDHIYTCRSLTYIKACYLVTYLKPYLKDLPGYTYGETKDIKPAKEPPAIRQLRQLDKL